MVYCGRECFLNNVLMHPCLSLIRPASYGIVIQVSLFISQCIGS